ncbi:hypothetical protein K469DRAFT_130103 [Zopfia rhizophila CBS 207.26]|uniref:Uncharacterized protein n=1 Tax=Zopfia rhizophila CBS 207.26 TaxID=1314779 RepID=A0A6A6EUA2_9PEZI|nr:hypothetical protein K469DRAFT_130103 [Zopfia rhizophila CBS 207.26]
MFRLISLTNMRMTTTPNVDSSRLHKLPSQISANRIILHHRNPTPGQGERLKLRKQLPVTPSQTSRQSVPPSQLKKKENESVASQPNTGPSTTSSAQVMQSKPTNSTSSTQSVLPSYIPNSSKEDPRPKSIFDYSSSGNAISKLSTTQSSSVASATPFSLLSDRNNTSSGSWTRVSVDSVQTSSNARNVFGVGTASFSSYTSTSSVPAFGPSGFRASTPPLVSSFGGSTRFGSSSTASTSRGTLIKTPSQRKPPFVGVIHKADNPSSGIPFEDFQSITAHTDHSQLSFEVSNSWRKSFK